jgi:hypothetical protein
MQEEALAYLQTHLPPLTLAEALPALRGDWEKHAMLACYLHFFPEAFAQSQARMERDPEQEAYSPGEIEFLLLVDRHLFPLPYLVDEDLSAADPEERQWDIPIVPCGRDWYEEPDIETGWQVLLLLAGYELASYALTLDRCLDWEVLLEVVQEARAQLDRLIQRAALAPAPLSSLPLALKMVGLTTDNVWLDSTPELPAEGWSWCIEHVEILKADWEACETITRQVNKLVEWLGAEPLARLREMMICLLKW